MTDGEYGKGSAARDMGVKSEESLEHVLYMPSEERAAFLERLKTSAADSSLETKEVLKLMGKPEMSELQNELLGLLESACVELSGLASFFIFAYEHKDAQVDQSLLQRVAERRGLQLYLVPDDRRSRQMARFVFKDRHGQEWDFDNPVMMSWIANVFNKRPLLEGADIVQEVQDDKNGQVVYAT